MTTNQSINDNNESGIVSTVEPKITDKEFFDKLINSDFTKFKLTVKDALTYFGTSERCNRFDIGNCIEFSFADVVKYNFDIECLPNARRIDCSIKNYDKLSIKYSKTGDITLHNSQGSNRDITMVKTILITPDYIYLISNELISKIGLNLQDYLKNNTDSLKLKRKILTQLKNKNYYHRFPIDLKINPEDVKHNLTAVVVYEFLKKRYEDNCNNSINPSNNPKSS